MDAINCDGLASPMTTEGKGGEQRARMVRDFWFFFLKKMLVRTATFPE